MGSFRRANFFFFVTLILDVGVYVLENMPSVTFNTKFENTHNKQQYGTKNTA